MRLSFFSYAFPGGFGQAEDDLLHRVFTIRDTLDASGTSIDGFWTVEHHGSAFAPVADPLLVLADIAARFKLLDVGTAVSVLPGHKPRVLAERLMLMQALCGGRLRVGLGTGYLLADAKIMGYEFGVRDESFPYLVNELLDCLAPGRMRETVGVEPGIPAPKILLASREPKVLQLAIERRLGLLFGLPDEQLIRATAQFREHGGVLAATDIVVSRMLYMAETEAEAIKGARDAAIEHLSRYDDDLLRGKQKAQFKHLIARMGEEKAVASFAKRQWVGTPGRIAESIARLMRNGVGEVAITPLVRDPQQAAEQMKKLRKLITEVPREALNRTGSLV